MESSHQQGLPEDKGLNRMAPHPEREPLARAKVALKERLLQRLREEVLAEFEHTDTVVHEALSGLGGSEAAVDAARDRFKDRLLEQAFAEAVDVIPAEAGITERFEAPEAVMEAVRTTMKAALLRQAFQQVVDELSDADVSIADFDIPADLNEQLKAQFKQQLLDRTFEEAHHAIRPSDAALPETATASDVMQPVREAFKAQLLAQVMQEAMEEIRDEVEAAPEHVMARSATAHVEDDSEVFDTSFDEDLLADVLEMDLWDDDSLADAVPTEEDILKASEAEAEELASADEDEGFFLSTGFEESFDIEPEDLTLTTNDPPDGPTTGDVEKEALRFEFFGDGGASLDGLVLTDPPEDDEPDPGEMEPAIVFLLHAVTRDPALATLITDRPGFEEGATYELVEADGLLALASCLDLNGLGEEMLNASVQTTSWHAKWDQVHRSLIESLAEHCELVPLPFPTAFPSEAALLAHLDDATFADEVDRLAGCAEWELRLYHDKEMLRQQVVETSDRVKSLMADIKSKPRGEARSLNKEMIAAINEEVEQVVEVCCNHIHEDLGVLALEVHVRDVPQGKEVPMLLLHHLYLIPQSEAASMEENLVVLQKTFGDKGFRFDVAGPRPPLDFARDIA